MVGPRIGRRQRTAARPPRLGRGARGVSTVIAACAIVAGALAPPALAVSGWTGPTQIGSVGDCGDVSAAIDGTGAIHVVAACGTNVRHLTDASGSWVTTTFSHPDERVDLGPRIAIDGDVVHVAYTRVIPEDDGARSIGVYHRQRDLAGTTWSTAERIGESSDELGSFAFVEGVLHATIADRDGVVFYETDLDGTLRRYRLPGATSAGALDVEGDGAARFAYETADSLRYAVFLGSSFDWWTVPGTDANSDDPQIALDASNKAHVIWTQYRLPDAGTVELLGTYYVTSRPGAWTSIGAARLTANGGGSSLEIDFQTSRPHIALATTAAATKYYTPASGKWSGLTIDPFAARDAALAIDRETGRVVVVAAREVGAGAPSLFLLTKP
jgi:hypothetical protein